ncbi:hypothetical protein AB0D14_37050 [Streptomyces sp. NPDC048484]|uniref:hypothetical protein n=1 Tax=Streptomyces sp. NPDC048484 TaxID=3155146 RepID=UPI003442E822
MKRLNPKTVPEGQSALFAVWRYHVIFADSRFVLTDAEPMHRDHAAVEQVFADLGTQPSLICPRAHSPRTPPG